MESKELIDARVKLICDKIVASKEHEQKLKA